MDLNTVTAVLSPVDTAALPAWCAGDAFLAGGTWLFSEPQTDLRRLVDLDGLGWSSLEMSPEGLRIGATCTIAALAAFEAPAGWRAASLIDPCCRALLGSFKIWNRATAGGNLCLALPAAPMAALCVALDGVCRIWTPGGERSVAARDFIVGPQRTVLAAGEVLTAIEIPVAALRRRSAFRQISLSPLGRSAALLIGTRDVDGFALTVTAATRHPVRLDFAGLPDAGALLGALEAAIPAALYYDDVHGDPAWRRHVTALFAVAIRDELSA